MLLSTVFVLRPLAEGALPLTQGNAIHAWFLHLVHQQDPRLASWLHSQERPAPGAAGRPRRVHLLQVTSGTPCRARLSHIIQAVRTKSRGRESKGRGEVIYNDGQDIWQRRLMSPESLYW